MRNQSSVAECGKGLTELMIVRLVYVMFRYSSTLCVRYR